MAEQTYFDLAQRSYIRMSEVGKCAHAIFCDMMGYDRRHRGTTGIAFEMGKALEPMINKVLVQKTGLRLHFAGLQSNSEPQLRFVGSEPERIGHGDGLLLPPAAGAPLSDWAQWNLPIEAQEIFNAGGSMHSEIKTMTEDHFLIFMRDGLEGSTFLRGYIDQAMQYLGTESNPDNDELWWNDDIESLFEDGEHKQQPVCGAESFKRVLGDHPRPQGTLFTVLCPGTKQLEFQYVPFDSFHFVPVNNRLESLIINPMRLGVVPEPTYDGKAPDCFFCPFVYRCPAVQRLSKSTREALTDEENEANDAALEEISIVAPSSFNIPMLESLAAEYVNCSLENKILDARQKEIKSAVSELIGVNTKVTTPEYNVSIIESSRSTPDIEAIREVYMEFQPGVAVPFKQSATFTTARISARKGASYAPRKPRAKKGQEAE